MIGRLARWLVILAVVVVALVVADRRGIDIGDVAPRLTQAITPAPAPGVVTETRRADLSGGDPDPDPVYEPKGRFLRHDISFGGKVRHWWSLAGSAPAAAPCRPPSCCCMDRAGMGLPCWICGGRLGPVARF